MGPAVGVLQFKWITQLIGKRLSASIYNCWGMEIDTVILMNRPRFSRIGKNFFVFFALMRKIFFCHFV
jgi:hypothetical protein